MATTVLQATGGGGIELDEQDTPYVDPLVNQRKSYADSKDAFKPIQPSPYLGKDGKPVVTQKSSRTQGHESVKGSTQSGIAKAWINLTGSIKDQWRRMTESNCDPYVSVELRPAMSNVPNIQQTEAIKGGGKFVEWTEYDNNELVFDLYTRPSKKYLTFRVFDDDIGDDRELGKAPIRLESVKPNRGPYYARVDLYHGKKWTGLIDVGARIESVDENGNPTSPVTVTAPPSDTPTKTQTQTQTLDTMQEKKIKYKLYVYVYAAYELEDVDNTQTEEENFWKFLKGLLAFIGYICFGATIFSFVEGKSFGMMVWFFIVSTCTVGYGDVSPATPLGQILNSFMIISNLFIFGWAFGVTFNYIYAQQRALLARGGRARSLRDFVSNHFTGVSKKLDDKLKDAMIHEREEFVEKIKLEDNMSVENNVTDKDKDKDGKVKRSRTLSRTSTELAQKQEEKRQAQESEKKMLNAHLYEEVIIDLLLLIGLMTIGTMYFSALAYFEAEAQEAVFEGNGWPAYYVMDPLRFTIMTMTTVGYGDMYPQTRGGKFFGAFYLIVGVSFLTKFVGAVFEIIGQKREQERKQRTMERALMSSNAMQEFDQDGSGDIDKYEFLRTMLIIRGEVTEKTIDRLMKKFFELDADGSGTIETADFMESAAADAARAKADIQSKDGKLRRATSTQQEYSSRGSRKSGAGGGADSKNSNNDKVEPLVPPNQLTPLGAAPDQAQITLQPTDSNNQVTPLTVTQTGTGTKFAINGSEIDDAVAMADTPNTADSGDSEPITPQPGGSSPNDEPKDTEKEKEKDKEIEMEAANKSDGKIDRLNSGDSKFPLRTKTDDEMVGSAREQDDNGDENYQD